MATNGATIETTRGIAGRSRRAAGDVAGTVRDLAGDVVTRIPDAATTTRALLVEADRQLRDGSDEMLSAGATLTFGFALGSLVAGANRWFVTLALIPAAAMSLVLLDRVRRPGRDRMKGN